MISFAWLRDFAHQAAVWQLALAIIVAFGGLYVSMAGIALWLTRRLLPQAGIGAIIDRRPLRPAQVKGEIGRSLISIAIFAAYGVLTIAADRAGWISIRWWESAGRFMVDLTIMTLWNEIHFYACHRFLHLPWWYRRVHIVHHQSVVPTPFSTYSFHWCEAALLSSVMILLLLVMPLGIGTVLLFPAISLALNSIGHMNYAIFPHKLSSAIPAACRRHTMHHGRVHGNFGFYLPWLDALLHTRIANHEPPETPP